MLYYFFIFYILKIDFDVMIYHIENRKSLEV